MSDVKTVSLHKILLELLLEFDKISINLGLNYSLSFGTLLGAIRHEGFIPWDDDVDIMMNRLDYNKFVDYCSQRYSIDSESVFFFQNNKTEKNYPYCISRLRKKNTTMIIKEWSDSSIHQGVYIDIVPLDNISDSKIGRILQGSLIILSTLKRSTQNKEIFFSRTYFNKGARLIIYSIFKLIPAKLLFAFENGILNFYNNRKTKKVGLICEGRSWFKSSNLPKPFDSRFIENFIRVNFEGYQLMVSTNYNELLTHWYGDYMIYPEKKSKIKTQSLGF